MIEGTHILGIRHHGPGSARGVVGALEAIRPQAVLVEGPPDADGLLALAAHAEMRPPVALLIYQPDEPKRAAFYPFAEFSPEWQAIRWALANQVPVRFMDLPLRHSMALEEASEKAEQAKGNENEKTDDHEETADGAREKTVGEGAGASDVVPPDAKSQRMRRDPLAAVAEAAGYSDSERWWEEQFEKRHEGLEIFRAIIDLIAVLRESQLTEDRDLRREAAMRQIIRETQKEGHASIAVICGAWHAPALATLPKAKADADLLRAMPKVAVAATWLPWTYRRLTVASGYGAGIHSPGYYEQLWTLAQPEELTLRWMTRVAHLLRAEDLESSTASIIEATRLAETTAVLRGCALPGLAEFNEAAQAVFCFGDATPMRLIHERLVVGARLGGVPDDAPQVPLQRDFQRETKRLRLPPEALDKTLDLDLRKPNDLDRSRLLHRLRLLRVPWGKTESARGKGTFRETWRLRWEPEMEVALIEGAPWGNTVEEAATRFAIDRAIQASALPELTLLIERLLLAELPEAIARAMHTLENQAALTSDVLHLMDALPPLAAASRYGNVRQTDVSTLGHIVTGLVARICAGLGPACASLNDEAASAMLKRVNATDGALGTLADEALRMPWTEALRRLAENDAIHGVLTGRCARLLFDANSFSPDQTATRLSQELSRANAPAKSAAWLEGFLGGSGLVLLHQPVLWGLLDGWLGSLNPEHFTEVLPLLRRAFSTFASPERRQMGELARNGGTGSNPRHTTPDEDLNEVRANRLLPTLAALLGP